MRKLLGSILMASALLACGGDNQQQSSASANAGGGGGQGGAGGAGGAGGQGGAGGGNTGDCAAGNLCFEVKGVQPGVAIEKGRLALVWAQFNDDGPDPMPLVAYDAAFDPAVTKIQIPIAQITLPTPDLLLCMRACDDEAMCPCTSEPQVGTAFVVVADDTDKDGKLSATEIDTAIYGVANTLVGYSQKEFIPSPAPFETLFTKGIAKDVQAYEIIPGGANTFDDLGTPVAPGTWIPLNVCPSTQAMCTPPFPNLT